MRNLINKLNEEARDRLIDGEKMTDNGVRGG